MLPSCEVKILTIIIGIVVRVSENGTVSALRLLSLYFVCILESVREGPWWRVLACGYKALSQLCFDLKSQEI